MYRVDDSTWRGILRDHVSKEARTPKVGVDDRILPPKINNSFRL